MMEFRDSKSEDLEYCRLNSVDNDVKIYPNWDLTGWNKTLIIDDEIIGVGGIVIFWSGFGEAWLCLSKNVEKHKVKFVLFLKSQLSFALKDLNLIRLEINVRTDYPESQKLVEALGFQFEGIRRKYLPNGKDAYLYAIVG